jgi:uncharacterized protein (TIGR03000 family)
MPPALPARVRSSVVILAALLGLPAAARAEWLSTWGHPVISLGWTPYDAVSQGHGNYPGSHGYIPGYGYYPGIFPSHYPWYDGPDDHHRAGPVAVAPEEPVPADAAVLRVLVPADAELLINGQQTVQRGSVRTFVSPPLAAGHQFFYDLLALWRENGKPAAVRRKVPVFPGDHVTVDVADRVAGETATLGMPRKLAPP